MLLSAVKLLLVVISQATAQAPGDEDDRCTIDHTRPQVYPDNIKALMDSYNYEQLLPGNGTGNPLIENAVWNDRSYDGNEATDRNNPTYWQHGAGGICRYQTRVCGFREEGATQNNWLFTQHIDKSVDPSLDNYLIQIHATITYAFGSCRERHGCDPQFKIHLYKTNSQRLPSTSGAGFMNRNNYVLLRTVDVVELLLTYDEVVTFEMQPGETGFYIAIQDEGTCMGISRILVQRFNCKPFQDGLVIYPDSPAPVSGNAPIMVSCVSNGEILGSATVTCSSEGEWGSQTPTCGCKTGYEVDRVSLKSCNRILIFLDLLSSSSVYGNDSESDRIDISGGFNFGTGTVYSAYVSTNGYISMGERVSTSSPEIPGTRPIVAPYAANINPEISGTVRYTEFTSTDSTQMSRVSSFIQGQADNSFYGTRMMVAEWDGVAEYSGSSSITSTFQCVLITDGSAPYAVFFYECGGMEWDGANIGWQATNSLYQRHPLSGSRSADIGCEYSSFYSGIVYRLDNHTCDSDQFTCGSGKCIPQSYVCNDFYDCGDSSDEWNCADTSYPTGTDYSPSSISAGVVAAIVVATLVVVIVTGVVIVVGIFCLITRKRKKRTTEHTNDFHMSPFEPADTNETDTFDKVSHEEIGVIQPQQELPAQSRGSLYDQIKHMIVPKHHLQLGEIVGQGESGLVYRGYIDMGEGNELVAVKTGKNLLTPSDREKLLKEVSIMLSFKHPNVMSLVAVCFDGEMPLLIMPFMSYGSLLAHVKQNRERLHCAIETDDIQIKAARKACMDMCYQVSKGMAYLAQHKFVHRDLAARNCMIDCNGVIKVADFGLTEDMYCSNYYRRGKNESGSDEKVPIRWMAPESIEKDIYNEATDVWSFGVTCWEVFTCGCVPYTGVPVLTLLKELRSGHTLSRPSNAACSDEIWNLMISCWSASSQERHRFYIIVDKASILLDRDASYLKLSKDT